jgi:hypothetical protein
VADEEYVSFENALRDLKITADQLKRLVSEGEIRAIRGEHNSMRFRKDEIDRLRQDSGKTLQFSEATSDTLSDDLLFDEADDAEDEKGASTVQMKPSAPQKPAARPAAPAGKPSPKPAAMVRPSPKPSPESRPVTPVRRTTSRSAGVGGAPVADPSGIGAGTLVALVFGFMVMAYATMVVLDISEDKPSGLTRKLAETAAGPPPAGG